ncbi:EscN/YscN/HrcN family type III secretion system ATPase [Clostridium thermosuccinogenes]|jgi:flagellum-specific ATP synthase|uniref:Type 3 secretion system ATPase n=1 Tax=Clostridium thermosuccinogenes TaxID=84032 RepID=A0A2K2FPD3_9CLOT|nr:flagellar protein export ATPase FliI [Pseudoclostridium thermosuccinogenes]AUS96327.1 EscN/YscN/HrcN family type III secretion system ATPase [Pseudoclostridium thermosuccinogenes]PNT92999.1 EscN/YscN/HrcN family type III secretion system ATPase [Pseudoclostridium thermosuccinogenes]PNT98541.1 EscN/YscN/HrcN family type III secretion system ATPase [Pseudoclostridium thermosuccinogenes]PNU00643.1 EscN/YscN/HrcN family type III secretion system ATPase [Pseudoclostridium thermosuccinogenes]
MGSFKLNIDLNKYKNILDSSDYIEYKGKVSKVVGLTIESNGPEVNIGELCKLNATRDNRTIDAEVVGFRENKVLLMPLGEMTGIGPGSDVIATGSQLKVGVGKNLVGRVLDGMGRPIDDKGDLEIDSFYPVDSRPPHPLQRKRITEPLPLGVKAVDGLLTVGKGQRIGIFAGSGVGKSTLLGMFARNTKADVNVIALIGERGREVREFIEKDLGEEGLARTVVVVATSDQPALIRLKGAMVATAVAEYFRDQGKDVLLMMDSLTRFSMAQREVGLAIGEPPVSRGYTPSVFSTLPKLLERSGNSQKGSITGLYTVLVDGDDLTEPVTDAARGILDGHIVLSRDLANKNQYPAIDVLASVSRVMSDIITPEHKKIANEIKKVMAVYKDAEDLINIGAYTKGSNEKIDYAIEVIDNIIGFLEQETHEKFTYDEVMDLMGKVLK